MVALRFEDMGDLVARGGIDGHMGFQHTLLSCSRHRDGVHLQVQQLRVGTVRLDLEGAAPSRSSRPARQADAALSRAGSHEGPLKMARGG